eukprot:CAMPEP_0172528398 /NCGR_PEP_ID=MMETSP1067-20121228/2808_1 /TAXON_ID=265564 ORGANISM="Thalassiosira punctigera, Strain Tpunct2005C2" /NCGR_SAMPLE_ID=MMETSP1067 /ASSEMBLY_ACC=CAM_ASM_000444 /LENGTH=73 /DNA_ID=CAMNT_0013312295 /DNA_START=320 /DNA_END=538 /DNA_ORIENTATION=-
MRLGRFLQRQYCATLPPVGLLRHAILNFPDKTREGEASEEEGGRGLVLTDLAEGPLAGAHAPLASDARPGRAA